ncbi:MAG: WG repeat-containing protein [Bacteroidia bacterium]
MCILKSFSQVTLVSDSCTNNYTLYSKVDDSVYHVNVRYGDNPIFSGFLINPDTKQLIKESYMENSTPELKNPKNPLKYHGICSFHLDNGILIKSAKFNAGKIQELNHYKNAKISQREVFNANGYTLYDYNENGTLYQEIEFSGKYKNTKYFHKQKTQILKEVYDSNKYKYVYVDRVNNIYSPNGNLIQKIILHKKSNVIHKDWIFYSDQSIQVYKEYDASGRPLLEQYYADRKGNNLVTLERFYKYDYIKGPASFSHFKIESRLYKDKWYRDTTYFISDSSLLKINFRENNSVFLIQHFGSFIKSKRIFLRDDARIDSLIAFQDSTIVSLQHYKDGEKIFSRTYHFQNKLIPEKWVKNLREKTILIVFSYLNDYSESYSNYREFTRLSELHHQANFFIDSSFSNGKLHMIKTESRDSFTRFLVSNGEKKLIYDKFAYRIAKDIEMCTVGIKDKSDRWVLEPSFNSIYKFDQDTNTLYFGESGQLTSIFNWKGERLLGPLRGIRHQESSYDFNKKTLIPLTDSERKSLGLKSRWVFPIHDDLNQKYYLLSLENKVIKQFDCPYELLTHSKLENNHPTLFLTIDSFNNVGLYRLDGFEIPRVYKRINPLRNGDFLVLNASKTWQIYSADSGILNTFHFKTVEELKTTNNTLLTKDSLQRPRLFSLDSMKYITSLKDFKLDYYNYNESTYLISFQNKHGVCNSNLDFILKPKYTYILKLDNTYLGCVGDTIDFYSFKGEYLNTLVCDSLYFYNNLYNSLSTLSNRIFKQNNLYGIVNSNGKVILPANYNMIAELNAINFIAVRDSTIKSFKFTEDSFEFENIFPLSRYSPYTEISNKNNRGILSASGKKLIHAGYQNSGPDRFDITSIILNNKFVGSVNSLGEWLFNSSDYYKSEVLKNGLMYVQTKEGLSGVVSCNGKTIIKPEHQFILYDAENQILWYNASTIRNAFNNSSYMKNIWKAKKTNSNTILSDTLESPSFFKQGFSILKNKHNLFGVIDKNLNVIIPFEYSNFGVMHDAYFFKSKKNILICDLNFNPNKTLILDEIADMGNKQYIGIKSETTFLIDSNFSVIDSSNIFFINYPQSIIDENSQKYHPMRTILKDIEEYEEYDEDEKEMM